MSKLARAIKDEVGRLGRKEVKSATAGMKRRLLALERLVREQRAALKQLAQQVKASMRTTADADAETRTRNGRQGPRLTARSIKSLRKRLRLTQAEFGKLAGVTPLAVYLWESSRAKPRGASRDALLRARQLGAREARRTLDETATPARPVAPKKGRKPVRAARRSRGRPASAAKRRKTRPTGRA